MYNVFDCVGIRRGEIAGIALGFGAGLELGGFAFSLIEVPYLVLKVGSWRELFLKLGGHFILAPCLLLIFVAGLVAAHVGSPGLGLLACRRVLAI